MQNNADPDGVGPTDAPEPETTSSSASAETGTETGPPPPGPQTDPGPAPDASTGDRFFHAVRRTGLVRTDDRWVGGVCAGLARRFGLDPLLVRGIVAATVLVGGFGLVCYGLAWALLPEARDGRVHLQETLAGRFDAAVIGALGMVLLGLVRGDGWLWWGRVPGFVQGTAWLAFLAVVVIVVVVAAKTPSERKNLSPGRPGTDGRPVPEMSPSGSAPGTATPATPPAGPVPPRPAWSVDPSTAGRPLTSPSGVPALAATGQWPTPAPVTTPPAPVATRQRRPGPGPTTVGVVVACTLIATAALLLADRSGHLDAPVALVAAGVCVVLAGLGIVVSGLRGRRSGVLGFLAIVTLLLAGPWAVVDAGGWPHHGGGGSVVTLTDVDSARAGVDQGAGDVVVDLRDLDLSGLGATPEPDQTTPQPQAPARPPATAAQTVLVPVNVGAGNVVLRLPEGVNTQVEVQVGAGRVEWQVGDRQSLHGVGLERTFRTDRDAAGPELVVHVSLGVGDLTISQEGDR